MRKKKILSITSLFAKGNFSIYFFENAKKKRYTFAAANNRTQTHPCDGKQN